MKLTKSQEQVIKMLKREHRNPLKSLDGDVFTKFEVKGFDFDEDFNMIDIEVDGKGKTDAVMIDVKSVSPIFLDLDEFNFSRIISTNTWTLSVSKRGKIEAYGYPEIYKSGEKTWTGIHIQ